VRGVQYTKRVSLLNGIIHINFTGGLTASLFLCKISLVEGDKTLYILIWNNYMKMPSEPIIMVMLVIGSLGFIQALHLQKHDKYCKTEAEWRQIYEQEQQDEDI